MRSFSCTALSVLLAGLMDITPAYGESSTVDILSPPQTVSFALTYPRSETYTTANRMPVVFEIANPQYASLLAPKITFSIADYDIFEGTCPVYVDSRNFTIDLQTYNLSAPSTPDPFYLTAQFDCLDFQVGQWFFAWSVETSRANVTVPPASATNGSSFTLDSIPHNTVTDQGNFVFETVTSGGNVIDLVAGTADSVCDVVPYSRQIDIVAIAEGSCSSNILDFASCAVVANDTGFSTSMPASSSCGSSSSNATCGGIVNATKAALINAERRSFDCPKFPMAHVPCNASEAVQRPSNVTSATASTTATPNASAPPWDGGDDGGGGGGDSRGTGAPRQPPCKTPKPRLACLFFRHNPTKYAECATYELTDFDAVKKHIKRKHMGRTEYYCPRCYDFFDGEEEKNQHIRDGLCATVPGYDVITAAEWNDANASNALGGESRPWTTDITRKRMWLWDKLFQGHPQPSPDLVYLQDIATKQMEPFSISAFQSALQTHMPSLQPVSRDLAEKIRQDLISANRGPQPYRKYLYPRNTPGTSNSSSTTTSTGPEVSVIADATLLEPITHFLQTERVEVLEPFQDATGDERLPQPVFSAEQDICSSSPGLHLLSALDVAEVDAEDNLIISVDLPPGEMDIEEAIKCVKCYPVAAFNPRSPAWGDETVFSCIDWNAKTATTVLQVRIPIRRDQISRLRAMETRGLMIPDPGSTDGTDQMMLDETWNY
ncbi:hypothetical protein SCUCBS95973_009806 [Sporothrix curviconia]|uniref:DUF7136 domain-containing protein n=1 Tax=Sporothrix curviconia TaxID=1260050 RepID=A0ABP0D182_9PEZI